MRKIGTEAEIERKRKRNILILSVFMLLVLVIGTFGYGFITGTGNAQQEQPASTINLVGGKWEINSNGQLFYFSIHPAQVEKVPVEFTSVDYSNSPVYIVSDNQEIYLELSSTLNRLSPKIQPACYGQCEEDLPEKNCAENLIVWRDSLENKVYQEQNCIFIEGGMKSVDAFLYKLLGII